MSSDPLADVRRLSVADAKAKQERDTQASMSACGIPSEYCRKEVALSLLDLPGVDGLVSWVRAEASPAFREGGGLNVQVADKDFDPHSYNVAEHVCFLLARALVLSGQTCKVLTLVEFVDQVITPGLSRFDDGMRDLRALVILDFDPGGDGKPFTARELLQAEAWLRRWLYDGRGLVTLTSNDHGTGNGLWSRSFLSFLDRRLKRSSCNGTSFLIK